MEAKLQQSWLMRWNQRIEATVSALAEIQSEMSWENLEPEQLRKIPGFKQQQNFVETLLLKSSLLRAQGQMRKSSAYLRKITQLSDQTFDTRGFRLLFEIGMDHWVHEDVAMAMESFSLAEKKARNEIERHFALINVLLCLESIDLPRESVEAKMVLFFKHRRSTQEIEQLLEQWKAYQMRKHFYTQLRLLKFSDCTGQADFFHRWVECLPYASAKWQKHFGLELGSKHLWQGAYRSRTLMGIWIPADLEAIRVTDAVDRLYLWTWWWLADHPQISTDKIIWTLESILGALEIDGESKDVLLLLRNAISWIVLVEPQLQVRVRSVLKTLKKLTSPRYPLLETEFALIQCLSHPVENSLVDRLQGFPCFFKIHKEVRGSSNDVLLPRLTRRLRLQSIEESGHFQLVVDLGTHEVKVLESYQVLKSKSLAKLLSLLQEKGRAQYDEFISDPDFDPPKLYNLVARVRKLISNSAIRIRGQDVYRGANWPNIAILGSTTDRQLSVKLNEDPVTVPSLVSSPALLQAARSVLPGQFIRYEIERALQVSKATACRMLDAWQAEGLIVSTGRAKAKRYQWRK